MSYEKPRLGLHMSTLDIIVAMSEGLHGATRVCAEILRDAEQIDPDNLMGGVGQLLWLDTLDIYGSKIWRFYKDLCGHDLRKMLGLMRACQLGLIRQRDLHAAIENPGTLDITSLLAQVKERLPAFQIEAPQLA